MGEALLWNEIKNKKLDFQFHRQVPMLDYIVDFNNIFKQQEHHASLNFDDEMKLFNSLSLVREFIPSLIFGKVIEQVNQYASKIKYAPCSVIQEETCC